MKKLMIRVCILLIACLFTFNSSTSAHSGRTDASGGHNCSSKSKAKGLCTGYHYHNGGSSSSGTTSKSSRSNSSTKSSNNTSTKKKAAQSSPYKQSNVKYVVNGTEVKLSPAPLLYNNTFLFPVRQVADSLGAQIKWNESDSTITITKNKKEIVLHLNNDSSLHTIKNTTYAPIRKIAEGLGAVVIFDSKQNIIQVTI